MNGSLGTAFPWAISGPEGERRAASAPPIKVLLCMLVGSCPLPALPWLSKVCVVILPLFVTELTIFSIRVPPLMRNAIVYRDEAHFYSESAARPVGQAKSERTGLLRGVKSLTDGSMAFVYGRNDPFRSWPIS